MKRITILFCCFLSLFSTLSFGAEKDFELCSTGGLLVQISGLQPTADFKDVLHSIPCNKLNDKDFLKIFKIISTSTVTKNEGYIGYTVLIKAGSFHIYMNDAYLVELNNTFYKIADRNDRVMLCNVVSRIHHRNLDTKSIEKLCASTD